jgi:hypothetical protein
MSSLFTLALKYPKQILYAILRKYRMHILTPRRTRPSHHQFYTLLGLNAQTPTTNATFLTADMIFLCQ